MEVKTKKIMHELWQALWLKSPTQAIYSVDNTSILLVATTHIIMI